MVLMKAHKRHGKHRKDAGSGDASAFVKKYPGFVVAAVIAVFVIIAFFASSSATRYSPTDEQVSVSKSLYEENQLQLDGLIEGVNEQLNGNYESTLEDDYFNSMKDDFVWLKARETELYYARPAQDAYAREIAFTLFMQKVLQANEDSAYLLESENFDSTIAAAQKVSAPVIKNLNSLEDFFHAGLVQEDYDAITEGSPYLESKFLAATNALIEEYYSAKALIINGASGQERKYVEAKKIMLLS